MSEGEPRAGFSWPLHHVLAARYVIGALGLAGITVVMAPSPEAWPVWILLWPALSLTLVAGCHLREDPAWMGKQPDGSIRFASWLLFAPYFVFVTVFADLKRRLLRQPPWHFVAEGLYVGRRPARGDLPADVRTVVDLTCEFPATRTALAAENYLCLPTLNRWIAPNLQLMSLLAQLRDAPPAIYVHCGAGKGRSALVAAALLLDRGVRSDAESAFQYVQAARPFVHLHEVQWRQLRQLARALSPDLEGSGIRPESAGSP